MSFSLTNSLFMRALWNRAINELRTGVTDGALPPLTDPDHVQRGEYGEMPARAPFIFVFMEPGRTASLGGPTGMGTFTCTLFCGAPPQDNGPDTVLMAYDMAKAAAALLEPMGPTWPDEPIVLDTIHADFSATRLTAFLQQY